ncbi:MAG: electron transfer flavoprotein subunit alpha/FixB family protein [Bacteroidota bacterium]
MSVLIYTDHADGKFKKAAFEVVAYGSALAQNSGDNAIAMVIGKVDNAELQKLGNYGANKVISITDAGVDHLSNQIYASIISQVAEKEGAKVVVFSHNNSGKALAPRLAIRLKAGMVSAASGLPVSFEPFVVKKSSFTGKAFAKVQVNTSIKVLTLAPNSFPFVESAGTTTIESFIPTSSGKQANTQVADIQKQSGKILLTDADIVVSGGRGMKGPENWAPIEELAELLGAGTACSRPVADEGWRPHHEHVGQTGKVVAPNLYIALGISGAIQHLGGISSSKYIIAINKDPEAPIFEAADYGVIGDVQKILPELITEVRKAKH